MKINNKSLKFANQNLGNKPLPIPFYMSDSEKKLSPLDYQTYKLRTNLKSGYSLWEPLHRSSRVRTSRMEMWRTH
eukprot:6769811-Ditylum_brightwellii.AAC.1